MPASGYELGMGQFLLPGLGIFLIGVWLTAFVGWLVRDKHTDTRNAKEAEKRLRSADFSENRLYRWDGNGWVPDDHEDLHT